MTSSSLGNPTTPSGSTPGAGPAGGGSSPFANSVPARLEEQPTVISQYPPLSPSELEGRAERLSPGDRLEHFEILELIGGGGMARVYRARDTRLERIVAVKVLTAEHAAEPETRQRFQNEAKSAAQLDHENIARVYYVGEDRAIPFIVYEYIQGTNLRAMVEERGPLPVAEAVHYTLQVAEALVHASRRNVVHRDIKPSNILITPEGQAKLIDLGLARIHKPLAEGHDLTATGVTLGTFDYIAPEQARDPRTADVRSDIYSLGCAFFFMLVGRPPFPEGTVLQKLLQHQAEEPPDPRIWRPELPETLIRILRKMLAKDPANRYPDAEELVADLLALAELVGLQPTDRTRTVWITPRHPRLSYLERHLPWLVPLAALLAGVVVLDWLWSSGGYHESPGPGIQETSLGSQSGPSPLQSSPPLNKGQGITSTGKESGKPSLSPPQLEGKAPPSKIVVSPEASIPASSVSPPPSAPSPAPGMAAEKASPAEARADQQGLQPDRLQATLSGGESFGGEIRGENIPPEVGSQPGPKTPPENPPPLGENQSTEQGYPVLVVGDSSQEGEVAFASLVAACQAARSGDVIQLRYNGRRIETPLRLVNKSLTIRATPGFRPTIAFAPSDQDTDPVRYPRQMFFVEGGELAFSDVSLEWIVPQGLPSEPWSFFQLGPGETVRLAHCVLSVKNTANGGNAYQPDVAFFRLRVEGPSESHSTSEAQGTLPVAIELTDCIVRGAAYFLRAEPPPSFRLSWNNGLLLTSESMLLLGGSSRPWSPAERIQVDLRHLTAKVLGGLCRTVTTEAAPHLPAVAVACRECILLGSQDRPLIEQIGTPPADLSQIFWWLGDGNFYEGISVFWAIQARNSPTPATLMTGPQWEAYWGLQREIRPRWNQVAWVQKVPADLPLHQQTPTQYQLAPDPATNPARQSARDGRDAGALIEQLPPVFDD